VVAFGTQECERSIQASAFNPSKAAWETVLQEALGPSYRAVSASNLQSTHLIIFVHAALLPAIGDVQAGAVARGLQGTLGSKGGVAVGFSLGNTSMLFLCCHLCAGEAPTDAAKRNADANAIDRGLDLCPAGAPPSVRGRSRCSSRYDRCVVLGDLNYRVRMPRAKAEEVLATGDLARLAGADELRRDMRRRLVFEGFGEAPLLFRPTYKLDREGIAFESHQAGKLILQRDAAWRGATTDVMGGRTEGQGKGKRQGSGEGEMGVVSHDGPATRLVYQKHATSLPSTQSTRAWPGPYDSSKKQRVPSWTDRVLVKPPNSHMHPVGYYAVWTALGLSDHVPVHAHVSVRLRTQGTARADRVDAMHAAWRAVGRPWLPHEAHQGTRRWVLAAR